MKEFIDKLTERLEEYKTKAYVTGITNNAYEFGACNAMDKAIEIVNEIAEEYKVSEMPTGWISVSERLPRKEEYVLCSLSEENPLIIHTVIIAQYDGCSYWHNGTVKAWMPLPAPFKEGE
jgi:hypothetical protein